MVRLVVLIFVVISSLSGCSVIPCSDPKDEDSLHRGEEYYGLNHELIRLDEGEHHPAVQVLLSQAEEARQQGNDRQALSYIDQARQIQPRNSEIFYRQAWLNYQVGNLSQAQQLLQRAKLYMKADKILQLRVASLQNDIDARTGY